MSRRMNDPRCPKCGAQMIYGGRQTQRTALARGRTANLKEDPADLHHTDRVEVFRCVACGLMQFFSV